MGPIAFLDIWRRENLLYLPRAEQRLLGHPAYSLVIEETGCMCGFCNVWMCVCVGFVMYGCVYVWVL